MYIFINSLNTKISFYYNRTPPPASVIYIDTHTQMKY